MTNKEITDFTSKLISLKNQLEILKINIDSKDLIIKQLNKQVEILQNN